MLPRERFAPHVTLARFRRNIPDAGRQRLGAFIAARGETRLAPFPVTHFSLYRSTLGTDAPVYDELGRYMLD